MPILSRKFIYYITIQIPMRIWQRYKNKLARTIYPNPIPNIIKTRANGAVSFF